MTVGEREGDSVMGEEFREFLSLDATEVQTGPLEDSSSDFPGHFSGVGFLKEMGKESIL